jgi:hypothetical protein
MRTQVTEVSFKGKVSAGHFMLVYLRLVGMDDLRDMTFAEVINLVDDLLGIEGVRQHAILTLSFLLKKFKTEGMIEFFF